MMLEQINGTWVTSGDAYFTPILRSGEFNDQWTLDQALFHVKQRRVALDIGAHVGLWTRELAREFKSVVAFEPDPVNFGALTQNTRHLANVKAMPVAIAPRSGCFSLSHEGTINSGEGFLIPLDQDHEWVPGLRLDDARFEVIDLLKCDAEGLEWEIFANGELTIRHCRPVIVLEENERVGVRYGGKADDARLLLEGWGMVEAARREFIPGAYDVVMRWPDPD